MSSNLQVELPPRKTSVLHVGEIDCTAAIHLRNKPTTLYLHYRTVVRLDLTDRTFRSEIDELP
jgi:hypothetical protein